MFDPGPSDDDTMPYRITRQGKHIVDGVTNEVGKVVRERTETSVHESWRGHNIGR